MNTSITKNQEFQSAYQNANNAYNDWEMDWCAVQDVYYDAFNAGEMFLTHTQYLKYKHTYLRKYLLMK